MKRIAILLTAIPAISFSQELNLPVNAGGTVEYTSVIKVDSVSDIELFRRAKLFMANAFVSYKDVNQLTDEASKTLVMKGIIPIDGSSGHAGWKTKITIQCKEGRYKYSFTDFYHEYITPKVNQSGGSIENEKPACGTFFLPKKAWTQLKQWLDLHVKELITLLDKSMQSSDKTNW